MWLGAIASFGHVLTNIHRLSASGLQQDFRPSGSAASDVSGFRMAQSKLEESCRHDK